MAYRFSGFFAAADETILQSALVHWPNCIGKIIDRPTKSYSRDNVAERHSFVGIGVKWPDTNNVFEDSQLNSDVLNWSKLFPATTFVWINAECWGGMCEYDGALFQNGATIHTEVLAEDNKVLIRLANYLGIILQDTPTGIYFEPFTRDYFPISH